MPRYMASTDLLAWLFVWSGSPSSGGQVHELGTRGIRSLAIARQDNEDGRWRFLGIMTFLDPPRPDTKHTIEQANLFGVEVRAAALLAFVRLYGIFLGVSRAPDVKDTDR